MLPDSSDSPLIDIKSATTYLGLSTATLARMRRDNNGPAFVRMGARVLYRKSDLDAYITSSLSTTVEGV